MISLILKKNSRKLKSTIPLYAGKLINIVIIMLVSITETIFSNCQLVADPPSMWALCFNHFVDLIVNIF